MESVELNTKILDVICKYNDDISKDKTVELLDEGYINSFDIVNIVSDLEDVFEVEILPEEILPENFHTIERISALIAHKLSNNI